MTAKKLGARVWLVLILIGLFGQFAWTIENMYFNVFLYNTISTDPGYIAAMVGWSAAAATLTTLLMGALSDRVGKRRVFISCGYLLWGLSTAAFGYVTKENAARLFPGVNAVAAAIDKTQAAEQGVLQFELANGAAIAADPDATDRLQSLKTWLGKALEGEVFKTSKVRVIAPR